MKKLKSITEIHGDIVPCPRKTKDYCYHNKRLRDMHEDEFADFVLDHLDFDQKFIFGKDELTKYYEIPYFQDIPVSYTRAYLYGVFGILKGFIKTNDPLNQKLVLKTITKIADIPRNFVSKSTINFLHTGYKWDYEDAVLNSNLYNLVSIQEELDNGGIPLPPAEVRRELEVLRGLLASNECAYLRLI